MKRECFWCFTHNFLHYLPRNQIKRWSVIQCFMYDTEENHFETLRSLVSAVSWMRLCPRYKSDASPEKWSKIWVKTKKKKKVIQPTKWRLRALSSSWSINPEKPLQLCLKTFLNMTYMQHSMNFATSIMITLHTFAWKSHLSEKIKGLCWWYTLCSWITAFHSRWVNLETLFGGCEDFNTVLPPC